MRSNVKFKVSVKFNKDFVKVDEDKGEIIIGIKSRPIKGKANDELVKKLAKHFHVPSSRVRIVSGSRSKSKIVEIENG